MAKSSAHAPNSQITFDFVNRKVVADFDGGDICIDGGLPLVKEMDDKRKLSKRVASCISDWRTGPVTHSLEDLVRQDIYMKTCGYPDANDANSLRNDAAFRSLIGTGAALAGQASMSRLENNVDAESIIRIQNLLPNLFLSRFKRAPKNVMLNMDTTCDPVYGKQQLSFWNGFYSQYCYTHLYLLADDGFPLGGVLRAGNAAPAEGGLSMLAGVVAALRHRRKKMAIEFRADSAFVNFQTLDWCEENNVTYYFALAPNHSLNIKIKDLVIATHAKFVERFGEPKPLDGKTWKQNEEKIRYATKEEGRMQELSERERRVRVYAEISYSAGTWSRDRRVIVRIDYTDYGEDVRFVVTNRASGKPGWIYETKYCPRAHIETNIKELKSQRCDRLSCQEWLPNQFRLLIHLLAYALIVDLRSSLPRYCKNIQADTFRWRFIKIAAEIQNTSRITRFRYSRTHAYQQEFRELRERIKSA